MLGYCAIGRLKAATPPISTMTIASTLASTGRSMKNLEIMTRPLLGRRDGGDPDGRARGRGLAARDGAPVGRDHGAVAGLHPFVDPPEPAGQQDAGGDPPLLDD